jgi:hypothetical protein
LNSLARPALLTLPFSKTFTSARRAESRARNAARSRHELHDGGLAVVRWLPGVGQDAALSGLEAAQGSRRELRPPRIGWGARAHDGHHAEQPLVGVAEVDFLLGEKSRQQEKQRENCRSHIVREYTPPGNRLQEFLIFFSNSEKGVLILKVVACKNLRLARKWRRLFRSITARRAW